MKLWQAILIGCDRRAQTFHEMFDNLVRPDRECRSCALGAAYEAAIGLPTYPFYSNYQELLPIFPILKTRVRIPGRKRGQVVEVIVHLNDVEQWPREKIALEFVKPIEEAMDNAGLLMQSTILEFCRRV